MTTKRKKKTVSDPLYGPPLNHDYLWNALGKIVEDLNGRWEGYCSPDGDNHIEDMYWDLIHAAEVARMILNMQRECECKSNDHNNN